MTTDPHNSAADPLRELAQAVLDGRLYMSTELWVDRDGHDHATTTFGVEDKAASV